MLALASGELQIDAYKKTSLSIHCPLPHSFRQELKIPYNGMFDECQVQLTVTAISFYGDSIDCPITLRCSEQISHQLFLIQLP
jgi:hypothetical protein